MSHYRDVASCTFCAHCGKPLNRARALCSADGPLCEACYWFVSNLDPSPRADTSEDLLAGKLLSTGIAIVGMASLVRCVVITLGIRLNDTPQFVWWIVCVFVAGLQLIPVSGFLFWAAGGPTRGAMLRVVWFVWACVSIGCIGLGWTLPRG